MTIKIILFSFSLIVFPFYSYALEEDVEESIKSGVVRVVGLVKKDIKLLGINLGTQQGIGHGTGFLVNDDGYIVTNHHVVGGTVKQFVIDKKAESQYWKKARVIWSSEKHDLAIIKVDGLSGDREPLKLFSSAVNNSLQGDNMWSFGFPGASDAFSAGKMTSKYGYSTQVKIDKGVARAINKYSLTGYFIDMIEHSATINAGNSGGPLADDCGRVVGINSHKIVMEGVDNTFYSISVKYLLDALRQNDISYDYSGSVCEVERGSDAGPLIKLFIVVTIFIVTFATWYVRSHKQQTEAGVSEVIRREVSRVLRKKNAYSETQNRETVEVNEPTQTGNWLLKGGRAIENIQESFSQDKVITIGRTNKCDVVIKNDKISRQHVRLVWDSKKEVVLLEDMGSANGTFLDNGTKLKPNVQTELKPGDKFYLAESDVSFEVNISS